jgi:hypothetical protein
VVLKVSDLQGDGAQQSYTLVVSNNNTAPVITSTPNTTANLNNVYQYQLTANDLEKDTLNYSLTQAPAGMNVDVNGLLTWAPLSAQLGKHNILLKVFDPYGAYSTQSYQINVTAINNAPVISSNPLSTTKLGKVYQYQLIATDIEGGNLTYSLIEQPVDMTISVAGLIKWQPEQLQSRNIKVEVSDSFAYSVQAWSLQVLPADPIDVELSVSSTKINQGEIVNIQVTAINVKGEKTINLSINGQAIGLDENNQAVFTAIEVGQHKVIATLRQGEEEVIKELNFFVLDPNNNLPPNISSEVNTLAKTENVYQYQVDAIDPEGTVLSYLLTDAPNGMTIDEQGLVQWQATVADVGLVAVTIEVSDADAKTASQSFNISVTALGKFNRRTCRVASE